MKPRPEPHALGFDGEPRQQRHGPEWLTDGRAIIGLGLGYRPEEFDSIGVPFKERVPRFVESVDVIRKLWCDDVVEHKGRFHTLSKVQASVKPRQKGGPPIWMAGDVEVAVRRAAKLADAWMPSPMVTEENVAKLNALFRDTRYALGLPAAKEFPIIRECHVGSGNALDEAREPLFFKYEAYASWGSGGSVPTSHNLQRTVSSSVRRVKWSTRSAAMANAPAPTAGRECRRLRAGQRVGERPERVAPVELRGQHLGLGGCRGGGDRDYNDVVVQLDFTSKSGSGLLVGSGSSSGH